MRPGRAWFAVAVSWSALSLVPWVNACGDGVQARAADAGGGGSSAGADGSGGSGGTWPPPCGLPCPRCGDGWLDPGEACDDGNTAFGDGCNGLCQIETNWSCLGRNCYRSAACGSGQLEPGEACDDGNRHDGDGCAADCMRIERTWYCPAQGMPCKPIGVPAGVLDGGAGVVCGNGIVETGEACDDGLAGAGAPGNDGHYGGCTAACELAPHCGDGIVDGPEDCDLGDRNGIDDGARSCSLGCMHRYCGDGLSDGDLGEECDLGGLNGLPGQDCDQACKNVSVPKPCPVCI